MKTSVHIRIYPPVLPVLFLCLLLASPLRAQTTVDWQWHDPMGSTNEDFGEKIIQDGDGNIYITAQFSGTVDFDPGAGTTNLTSAGGLDAVIACYTAAGALQWAKRIGGTGEDRIWEIEWKENYLYVTGSFSNTVDFDPGAGTTNLTSAGNLDIFFAKYEDDGDYVWVKGYGSADRDEGWAIAVDGDNDVLIAGGLRNTVDVDPGAGTTNLTSAGSYDCLIAKYDNNGNFVWGKRVGSTGFDFFYTLDVDGNGNLFVGGFFEGTVDFDPNAGTQNRTSSGNWDCVVASYDTDGNYRWANATGGGNEDRIYALRVDGDNDVYVGGWFSGTNIDFNPGTGSNTLTSQGGNDAFFAKYENDGDYVWAKSIGGTGFDGIFDIYVDASEEVYICGQFNGTNVDFDPGSGSTTLTSSSTDIFFGQYDANGGLLWARNPSGTSANDNFRGIWVDESTDEIYLTGHYGSTVDFDVETGVQNANSQGVYDIIITKYLPDYNPLPVELAYFDASLMPDREVLLSWSTYSELNNSHFTLEHSADGMEWKEIDRVAGAGNSNTLLSYTSLHHAPVGGVNYYRLTQWDYDGQHEVFDIRAVNLEEDNLQARLQCFPNPSADDIQINLQGFPPADIYMVDDYGRIVHRAAAVSGTYLWDVRQVPPGHYTVLVQTGSDRLSAGVVVN